MEVFDSSDKRQTRQAVDKLESNGGFSYVQFVDGQLKEKRIFEGVRGIVLPLTAD